MKRKITVICVLLLLTSAALFSSLFLIGNCNRKIPEITQINYDYSSHGEYLTVKDALKIMKQIKNRVIEQASLSFCAEDKSTLIRDIEVRPVLTNSVYFKNFNIDVKGFDEDSVVISRQLALRLFFSTDVIGKKIRLYDKYFSVAGLYDNKDNFVNAGAVDNTERVYLSYKALENGGDVAVTEFSCKSESHAAVVMEQMNLRSYYFTSLSDKLKVIDDFRQLILLVIYCAVLIVGLTLWLKICKAQLKSIRKNLRRNYIPGSIKAAHKNYLILFAAGTGIPCALILLFILCGFEPFIIPAYIPYDNIFDIGYYIGRFLESLQQSNSAALAGSTFLLRLYSFSFTSLMFLTVLFAVLLTVTIIYIRSVLKKS